MQYNLTLGKKKKINSLEKVILMSILVFFQILTLRYHSPLRVFSSERDDFFLLNYVYLVCGVQRGTIIARQARVGWLIENWNYIAYTTLMTFACMYVVLIKYIECIERKWFCILCYRILIDCSKSNNWCFCHSFKRDYNFINEGII